MTPNERTGGLTGTQLKLFAMAVMLIDHLGAFRREILTDLYNFSAIDQNVSDKGIF